MTARDTATRAVIMAAVANEALKVKDGCRETLAGLMVNGEKLVAVDPDHPELPIGKVIRQEKTGSAAVTDRAAFTGWMSREHPGSVQTVVMLPDDNRAEAIEVLHTYAPHLLVEEPQVMPWAEAEVLKLSEAAGEPVGPHGETDVPGVTYCPPKPGTVAVTPSPVAIGVIARMVREGRLDIRTGELLAIEGASQASDSIETSNSHD